MYLDNLLKHLFDPDVGLFFLKQIVCKLFHLSWFILLQNVNYIVMNCLPVTLLAF